MLILEHIAIDPESRTVYVNGKPVRMLSAEYEVLYYLASNAGQLVSVDQIIAEVWPENGPAPAYIRNSIALVRRKVEKDPRRPLLIRTVYGKGYKFCSQVEEA